MQGSPRHRLDLLQRFADESIDVEEFSASYWSIQPLERDLLSHTPDPKPEARLAEDGELRRRAASMWQALIGQQDGSRRRLQWRLPGGGEPWQASTMPALLWSRELDAVRDEELEEMVLDSLRAQVVTSGG